MLICGHPCDLPYFDGILTFCLSAYIIIMKSYYFVFIEMKKLFGFHLDVNVNAGRHLESG